MLHRVRREGKERRRLWAQRKTPRPAKGDEDIQNVAEAEPEPENESLGTAGMLPSDIVEMLAAREKYDIFFVITLCVYLVFNIFSHMIPTERLYLIYRQVFLSDSEDEKAEVKPSSKRKKKKSSG